MATEGVADTHGFELAAVVPVPVNWVVDPAHTLNVPAYRWQCIYRYCRCCSAAITICISNYTAVPAETPVTKPELFTVATDGLAETHGFELAVVPEPVNGSC